MWHTFEGVTLKKKWKFKYNETFFDDFQTPWREINGNAMNCICHRISPLFHKPWFSKQKVLHTILYLRHLAVFFCGYLRGKFTTDSFMHIPRYCVPCLDVNIALGLPKERNLLSSALFYYLKDSFPIKVTPLILAATRGTERKDACNFRLHLEAPFIFCEAPSSLHSRHYDIIIN